MRANIVRPYVIGCGRIWNPSLRKRLNCGTPRASSPTNWGYCFIFNVRTANISRCEATFHSPKANFTSAKQKFLFTRSADKVCAPIETERNAGRFGDFSLVSVVSYGREENSPKADARAMPAFLNIPISSRKVCLIYYCLHLRCNAFISVYLKASLPRPTPAI